MRRAFFSTILLVTSLTSLVLADQVTLKNGDRLTGSIEKADSKSLVIKSEFAGEVTIQWAAVEQITSDQQLHVGLANGKMAVGKLTTQDGQFEVATAGGAVVAAKDNIVEIRNDTEQAAYEQSLHPGLTQNWEAGTNIGFALTRGNSETKNLSVGFTADRKTLHDKLALYANAVYATNDAPGATPTTTADNEQGGARYDHNLNSRTFGFVSGDFQADSLQTLNLRSILGGGLGYHLIKRDATTLDILGGANYTHESYDAFSRSLAGATVGDEFMHKIAKNTVINQTLYFYPDLSNTGEYRGTFNFSTVTKISKWLGWQNSYNDIYVSDPPLGKKKNDIVVTTGLNITLIRGGGK